MLIGSSPRDRVGKEKLKIQKITDGLNSLEKAHHGVYGKKVADIGCIGSRKLLSKVMFDEALVFNANVSQIGVDISIVLLHALIVGVCCVVFGADVMAVDSIVKSISFWDDFLMSLFLQNLLCVADVAAAESVAKSITARCFCPMVSSYLKSKFPTLLLLLNRNWKICVVPSSAFREGGRNIMDEVDIEDLTIEQYLRLTQENQTPKKIEDMTIAEYVEYEKKMNENHISNTKTYLPTYFSKSAPTHDPNREFAHYFGHNQPGVESDCDSEDMEEEVKYMTEDEVVMSEQEESNETSSIASNDVDTDDDNTSPTASCLLPKELSPGSFLLPFNIDNHNIYAITTLEAKDNIKPLDFYKYLNLDK
ncbi:hypothetical protein Tco_0127144 [Tanacetum coccineum]